MPADVTGTSILTKDNEGNNTLQFQKKERYLQIYCLQTKLTEQLLKHKVLY